MRWHLHNLYLLLLSSGRTASVTAHRLARMLLASAANLKQSNVLPLKKKRQASMQRRSDSYGYVLSEQGEEDSARPPPSPSTVTNRK